MIYEIMIDDEMRNFYDIYSTLIALTVVFECLSS